MKARRAVVVVSAAQHSRVHRCWHLLIQTLHCGWRVLHCGRRVLHCGRRRSIEIGMLVHKDLHCWSVLRIFTNQGKVSSNIFVNIKIFLRNLRKYLIIYPLDKNPWFGPLWAGGLVGCGSLAISSLLTFMTSRGGPNNHANRNQCPGAAHPSSYTHFLWKHANALF